jgi:hypothetical protein
MEARQTLFLLLSPDDRRLVVLARRFDSDSVDCDFRIELVSDFPEDLEFNDFLDESLFIILLDETFKSVDRDCLIELALDFPDFLDESVFILLLDEMLSNAFSSSTLDAL